MPGPCPRSPAPTPAPRPRRRPVRPPRRRAGRRPSTPSAWRWPSPCWAVAPSRSRASGCRATAASPPGSPRREPRGSRRARWRRPRWRCPPWPAAARRGAVAVAEQLLAAGVREVPAGSNGGAGVLAITDGHAEAWCADFVSFAYWRAGLPLTGGLSGGWRIAGALALRSWFVARGRWMPRAAASPAARRRRVLQLGPRRAGAEGRRRHARDDRGQRRRRRPPAPLSGLAGRTRGSTGSGGAEMDSQLLQNNLLQSPGTCRTFVSAPPSPGSLPLRSHGVIAAC